MMARRKRYLRGRIYKTNDSLFSRDGYRKSNRRVVALNNDKNNLHVVKIKSLYDKNTGNKRSNLIPIENYSCLDRPSGIDPFVHKRTGKNAKIKERKLNKTSDRLNKWDLDKIKHLK